MVAGVNLRQIKRSHAFVLHKNTLYDEGSHKKIIEKIEDMDAEVVLGDVYNPSIDEESCIAYRVSDIFSRPDYLSMEDCKSKLTETLASDKIKFFRCNSQYTLESVIETRGIQL